MLGERSKVSKGFQVLFFGVRYRVQDMRASN
jgi:hypothetical protein